MKKWLLGIALLPLAVLAFAPVSVQATVQPNAQPAVYRYLLDYIPYEQAEDNEPELPAYFRTTANLNLRRGPSTDAARVATINRGTRIQVTDFRDGEWFAVTVNGQSGYMYAEFLTELVEGEALATAINGTVERLHWSEARQLTTAGRIFTVIDVRTGISWQMASFSNGNHADVETITADDTAAMRRAWGGRWDWAPRPMHVIIGDRILAASLNGMPHAGSTRSGNNMNGHVCLHFYGSSTHNGNRRHTADHQNAVNEAFRAGN